MSEQTTAIRVYDEESPTETYLISYGDFTFGEVSYNYLCKEYGFLTYLENYFVTWDALKVIHELVRHLNSRGLLKLPYGECDQVINTIQEE